MDEKELQQFKRRLEKNKKEIERELKKLEAVPDFGNDIDSLEEESDETEEYGNQLAVATTLKDQLADIEVALKKIKEGKYGICEKCHEQIFVNLLKIVPESRLCQNCKKGEAKFL